MRSRDSSDPEDHRQACKGSGRIRFRTADKSVRAWIRQRLGADNVVPKLVVTFTIFDGDAEWEARVMFDDEPDDVVRESIEMAILVVEEAKRL
jgi:hypothetical protein